MPEPRFHVKLAVSQHAAFFKGESLTGSPWAFGMNLLEGIFYFHWSAADKLLVATNYLEAKLVCRRSGVSAERRFLENEGFGFLPKAATLPLQRSHFILHPPAAVRT